MTVCVQWDNQDKTILRYDVEGHWTWDEFLNSFTEAKALTVSVSHTVHFIVNPLDPKSRGYLPPETLTHVIRLYRVSTPNAGSTVVIGGTEFLRTLNSVSRRFYPQISERYLFTDSLDEARKLLLQLTDEKSA